MARLPFSSFEGGAALKLFIPDDLGHPAVAPVPVISPRETVGHPASLPGSELTIELAWQQLLLPEIQRKRSPDTLSEYETHIRRWHEFWRSRPEVGVPESGEKYRIKYPVLPKITRSELLLWRNWLEDHEDDLSNRTINKHLGSIQSIGKCAALHEKIVSFPTLKPLPTTKAGRKLHLSYDEAETLKRACQVATWPDGLDCPAPLYWEALFVGFCVYGFRTQEQAKYLSRMTSLNWEDLRDDPETPHPDGKAMNEHGWICYTPQKQRDRKPEPLVLPIVEAYRKHLDAIRPVNASGPVFPFPLCSKSFYAQWKGILAAAGVKPKAGLDGIRPQYQIKHLRKTASTWLNDHGSKIGTPGIGDQITGHADDRSPDKEVQSKVSRDHYDFAEDRVLRALTTLPLPASFQAPLCPLPRQQRFF